MIRKRSGVIRDFETVSKYSEFHVCELNGNLDIKPFINIDDSVPCSSPSMQCFVPSYSVVMSERRVETYSEQDLLIYIWAPFILSIRPRDALRDAFALPYQQRTSAIRLLHPWTMAWRRRYSEQPPRGSTQRAISRMVSHAVRSR